MASEQSNELLMRMVISKADYLRAESRTVIAFESDDLAKDYNNGSFFSVDDFSFGMNIDDRDSEGVGGQNKSSGPQVKFGKWKSASAEEIKAMSPFPLRMDEFSITRRYDCASPVLFQKCAKSESFQSASLIKRKAVGDKLRSFLRFDFDDVLVTHIDWQDAEVIKETFKFVFRKMTVQYKTQAHSGTLNAANPVGSVSWTYNANLRKPAKVD
jgi:type VI protein secretion system component Hcp